MGKRFTKVTATKKPTTWVDDSGYERGVCKCGVEPSSHPDDAHGGLDRCANCYAVTCAACRECCADM